MKKCEIVGIEGFAGGNLLFFDVKESLLIYDFFLTGFFFFFFALNIVCFIVSPCHVICRFDKGICEYFNSLERCILASIRQVFPPLVRRPKHIVVL